MNRVPADSDLAVGGQIWTSATSSPTGGIAPSSTPNFRFRPACSRTAGSSSPHGSAAAADPGCAGGLPRLGRRQDRAVLPRRRSRGAARVGRGAPVRGAGNTWPASAPRWWVRRHRLPCTGNRVYPEIPAALALLAGVALITGPLGRHALVALVVALNALPWLGARYLPVAAALVVSPWSGWYVNNGKARLLLAASLALSGVVYFVAHRLLWGGWTSTRPVITSCRPASSR